MTLCKQRENNKKKHECSKYTKCNIFFSCNKHMVIALGNIVKFCIMHKRRKCSHEHLYFVKHNIIKYLFLFLLFTNSQMTIRKENQLKLESSNIL